MPAGHILAAAGAGVAGALLFASLLTGTAGILLAYLAPLPIFTAGLALGIGAAAIAGAAGVLVTFTAGGVLFAIIFAILSAGPAFLLTRQALLNRPDGRKGIEWYPPGGLVVWLAGIATATFSALFLLLSGSPAGLEGFVRDFLGAAFKTITPADMASEAFGHMVGALARYLPGIVAMSWMTMIAVNGALAQGLLVRFGYNRRPSPRMADIELPQWLPIATAIAAVGAFMPGVAGFVGGNLLLIALMTFTFAGLAVVHAMVEGRSNRLFWLVMVYAFTITFTWPVALLAVLGIIETWVGLRRRFVAGPPRS